MLPTKFLEYGFALKIEKIAHTLQEIEWCQGGLVETNLGWKFVRNPHKVLSTAACSTKYVDSYRAIKRLMGTIGMGESHLNAGVPVLQEFSHMLIRVGDSKPLKLDPGDDMYYRVHTLNLETLAPHPRVPITDKARVDFSTAFGICVETQRVLEDFLGRIDLDPAEPITFPSGDTTRECLDWTLAGRVR